MYVCMYVCIYLCIRALGVAVFVRVATGAAITDCPFFTREDPAYANPSSTTTISTRRELPNVVGVRARPSFPVKHFAWSCLDPHKIRMVPQMSDGRHRSLLSPQSPALRSSALTYHLYNLFDECSPSFVPPPHPAICKWIWHLVAQVDAQDSSKYPDIICFPC